jgi:hypothetical protein
MRSRGNDLFRVTMMRPARNMPEVASPSEIKRGWVSERGGSAERSRKGTNQRYLGPTMFEGL